MPRSIRSWRQGPLLEQPGQEQEKIGGKSLLPSSCFPVFFSRLLLAKPDRKPVTEGGDGPGSEQGADRGWSWGSIAGCVLGLQPWTSASSSVLLLSHLSNGRSDHTSWDL